MKRANLRSAHLERANLSRTDLTEAFLREAHLEDAVLGITHTALTDARPKHASIAFGMDLIEDEHGREVLEQAPLGEVVTSPDDVHLERADLAGAHLERATLIRAHLEGASLREAYLEEANLINAHIEGTDLRGANVDSKTRLSGATLDSETKWGDIQWGGIVNLTQLPWQSVKRLGDEKGVGLTASVAEHEAVVRAYRQVGAQLRAQGMNEVADRFAYRAQVCQRSVLLKRGRIPQWLGWWILFLLAGYGYRPGRSLLWYLSTIAVFAFGYYSVGHPSGPISGPLDAIVFSVASFHGRGFFPNENVTLHSPVTVLAALEAMVGLLIEISFIATFTQRFFGSK